MHSVAEIEQAIQRLSPQQERELREWLQQRPAPEDDEDILVPAAYRQKVLDAIDKP